MRIIDIYWDVVSMVHRSAVGSEIPPSEYPYIIFKERPLIRLHLVRVGEDGQMQASTDLSAEDTYTASIDADYTHSNGVPCRSSGDQVNDPADWSEADPSQGKFSFRISANTSQYQTIIGSTEEKTNAKLEVLGYESGTGDLVAAIKMPFRMLNIQDAGENLPEELPEDIITQPEADARYVPKSGAIRRNEEGYDEYLFSDNKFRAFLPSLDEEGKPTFGWGPPID